jgi:CRISPR-associated exonuclease Cas4
MGPASDAIEAVMFTVTDLKQYTYCARVVYYTYCLPFIRPTTFKMERGIAAHEDEKERERRRSMRLYGVPDGERQFDVYLRSAALGLAGRVDLVIRVPGSPPEAIPVDYKHSRQAGTHVRRQLAAYALLIGEQWDLPVWRGYIYLIPTREAREVRLTPALLGRTRAEVAAMREMVATESMPDPPSRRAPCIACEFRRFCNDV